ncbi:MAG: hypothetical protein NC212_05425 [Staphylococcus sp.]|nr:hypothetical protein [Staphylococcus sp.]
MWKASKAYRHLPGFRAVKRAWRSRGFGVHSPFAFRFITSVLRQKGEYYAYADMRRFAPSASRFRRLSLLFRLVCEFRPAIIAVSNPSIHLPECRTMNLASSAARLVDMTSTEASAANMLLIDGSRLTQETTEAVNHTLGNQGVVIAVNCNRMNRWTLRSMLTTSGVMTFSNHSGTIILVSRWDLPRQDFEINF